MDLRRDGSRRRAPRVPGDVEDGAHQADGDAGHDQLADGVSSAPRIVAADCRASDDGRSDDDAVKLGEHHDCRPRDQRQHREPSEIAQLPGHEDEPGGDAEQQHFAAGVVREGQVEEPGAGNDRQRDRACQQRETECPVEGEPAERAQYGEDRNDDDDRQAEAHAEILDQSGKHVLPRRPGGHEGFDVTRNIGLVGRERMVEGRGAVLGVPAEESPAAVGVHVGPDDRPGDRVTDSQDNDEPNAQLRQQRRKTVAPVRALNRSNHPIPPPAAKSGRSLGIQPRHTRPSRTANHVRIAPVAAI